MGSSAVLMPMHFSSMSIARPKSATRTSLFASSRMLCGFRSLCTRLLEWQKAMASAIWMPRSKKVEYLGRSAGRASERVVAVVGSSPGGSRRAENILGPEVPFVDEGVQGSVGSELGHDAQVRRGQAGSEDLEHARVAADRRHQLDLPTERVDRCFGDLLGWMEDFHGTQRPSPDCLMGAGRTRGERRRG